MARIKIRCTVVTRYGTFGAGDVLTVDDAFAAHLVNDCGAADYAPDSVLVELADAPVDPRIETAVVEMEVESAPKRRGRPPKAPQ